MLRNQRALLIRNRLRELQKRERFVHSGARKQAGKLPTPAEELEQRDRQARIKLGLLQLSDLDRQVLQARAQGATLKQIALDSHEAETAVRQRYIRALSRLRDAYFGKDSGGKPAS